MTRDWFADLNDRVAKGLSAPPRATLLSCPFCGSPPEFVPAEEGKGLAALIHCTWEHCAARPSVAAHEDGLAASFWNHRRASTLSSHHSAPQGE